MFPLLLAKILGQYIVVGCIWRIKLFLSTQILMKLYFAMIPSHFDYCCTSWGSSAKIHKAKIQKLQNNYARIIFNDDYYTPQRSMLRTLGWQRVEDRKKYQYCVSVYKIQK